MFKISGIQKKWPALVILGFLAIAGARVVWVFPSASNQGYAPEQPIPFSHKIMAGDFKIPCLYCHTGADKSRHAVVPAMNVCLNCHSVVKADSPFIQKLKQVYADGKALEWVRVHELPDFVYFSHERHVSKGVSCETCHGDVKTMERVVQVAPLTMGWCLDCHRGATTPPEVLARVFPRQKNPKGPVASTQCNTCHQ
ncbi:MAG: hypothetical protein A2X94_17420 [Bdellovibrionales bacterium GWB1_55_8]|nr:MAG: hypothetical protein A2X94_17420 [Bdellovibrionales bacterium GWB1_55_8]